MRPRAVLLDLYETLVSSNLTVMDAGRAELAARAGIPAVMFLDRMRRSEPERFRGRYASVESELAAVLTECGAAITPPLLRELVALERAAWSQAVQLYDDALPAVRALRSAGHRIALVSNCGHQTAARVAELGLERELDAVVLSCQVGATKPNAAIFRTALGRLGASPAEAVFVDDLPQHLAAARELGLRTVLVDRDRTHRSAMADARIASLVELPGLLGANGLLAAG